MEESLLMELMADATDATRLVYADWLEDQGRSHDAEFLRHYLDTHGCSPWWCYGDGGYGGYGGYGGSGGSGGYGGYGGSGGSTLP
jgi:uncharacterized protein (TIGR02996 family)